MATIAPYPTPDLGGAIIQKERKLPPDYESLLTKHVYEDEGISVNRSGLIAPQDFELTYACVTPLLGQIHRDHYDEAFHDFNDFSFRDRDGNLHTNVRYVKFEYDHTKIWSQQFTVVLRVYPA
jgi:hypothetical protein